ncbi:S-adenosyl-L-methionine-dependent methyltransferase [Lojkania enalia]|uniref:S-adenosyl-L-methionine-dependent methyltransferase n=1 Tax=Lojkania enalia TaxID=147567 RepID=A0A9P4JYR8_9PLEO|nr:S-adenosyl-L-methionine-dependent methyltransferase [Didymosphaeria enalia]
MTAAQHFNASAASYEKMTGGCTRELACLVLDLPELAQVAFAESVVLDNACGPGIVSEEIVHRYRKGIKYSASPTHPPTIHAVDPAPNMVDIARSRVAALLGEDTRHLSTGIMPGEKLEFADAMFTHSITNLGILFYSDGAAGARELHRTLKDGGVAIVTAWVELRYLDHVIRPSQKRVRPEDAVYQLPVSEDWFSVPYVKNCLSQGGGFREVRMTEHIVHYGAATVHEVAELLLASFQQVYKDWDEIEQQQFREAVLEHTKNAVEEYTMPNGLPGVGIPMVAMVAVCTK